MSKEYECKKCKKAFNRKWNMKRHFDKCSNEKIKKNKSKKQITNISKYICCEYDYKTKQRFEKHLQTAKHLRLQKGIKKITHKCPLCEYSTKYTTHLKTHKKKHLKKPDILVEDLNKKQIKILKKQIKKLKIKHIKAKAKTNKLVKQFQKETDDITKKELRKTIKEIIEKRKKYKNEIDSIENHLNIISQ